MYEQKEKKSPKKYILKKNLSDLPRPSALPKINVHYIRTVCGCGRRVGSVELCCRPYTAEV
jgi:hypothetical protein